MYGFERWTIKKAEHWKTDAFELWCWKRLLKVPWPARTSNQSILKEIDPECSLEELTAKLQYWPPDMKSWLIGKYPVAGKNWGQEEKGATEGEMVGWHQWLNGFEFEQIPGDSEGKGSLACCTPWGHKKLDTTEWLTTTALEGKFSGSS